MVGEYNVSQIVIIEHAMSDTTVNTCVTVASRLRVGVLGLT